MIKEKDLVIVTKDKTETDLKPLVRTKWKKLVDNTYAKIEKDKIYIVEKIKDDYAVIRKGIESDCYYLIKIDYLNKAPFKMDEKVITTRVFSSCPAGEIGVIRNISSSGWYGVEFDEGTYYTHTLDGYLSEEKGYYIPYGHLKMYDEYKKEEDNKTMQELTKEISNLTKEIKNRERFQDIMNEAVIEKGKEIAVEDLKEKLKKDLDKFVQEKYGILPKMTIEIINKDYKKEMNGIFHKEFDNICRIVSSDIPLMLVGSAGAGKNYTLEQVSKALNLDFYFSNAVNQEYKLTGFIDANGKYHETEFYKAFTKGGMFFLDEIDASCPECLVILNSAIANRYFDFPTGRVVAHKDFRVVCAGNTYGTGADMIYVGRNVLDGATLDRFVVLPFDYDEEVEKQLAYDDELYKFIKDLRKAINGAGLRYIVSMRALINSSKLLNIGMSKRDILKTAIIKNMQVDDLNNIIKKLNNSSEWVSELKKMCD